MTPEERETTTRLLWEAAFLKLLASPGVPSIRYAAELADSVVKEWRQRFEPGFVFPADDAA